MATNDSTDALVYALRARQWGKSQALKGAFMRTLTLTLTIEQRVAVAARFFVLPLDARELLIHPRPGRTDLYVTDGGLSQTRNATLTEADLTGGLQLNVRGVIEDKHLLILLNFSDSPLTRGFTIRAARIIGRHASVEDALTHAAMFNAMLGVEIPITGA